MVVFDATMLMLLVQPDSGKLIDPKTGQLVNHVPERIAAFISQADKTRTKIGIPTPALSEVLVRAGSSAVRMVEKIKEFSVFEILPFDELSAIEVAMLTRAALDSGDKRAGSTDVWNKIKYDRQIASIASNCSPRCHDSVPTPTRWPTGSARRVRNSLTRSRATRF